MVKKVKVKGKLLPFTFTFSHWYNTGFLRTDGQTNGQTDTGPQQSVA